MDPREMDARALYEQAIQLPFSPLCNEHGRQLLSALIKEGLGGLLNDSRETPDIVVEQGMDLVSKIQQIDDPSMLDDPDLLQKLATPVNYEPLLMSIIDVFTLAFTHQVTPFACVICQLNQRRTPDGRCVCANAECPAKAPGSIPDFEGYLVDVARHQGEWARENGLIA